MFFANIELLTNDIKTLNTMIHILKKKSYINIYLIGIILLAFVLRVFMVNLPVLSDEAEFGYSAYSIINTGKNQYNQSNYLLFTTPYNDRYPAIYSYSTIPFIMLFGLNAVTERLPSILFGTFSCLLLFLITIRLASKVNIISYHLIHTP